MPCSGQTGGRNNDGYGKLCREVEERAAEYRRNEERMRSQCSKPLTFWGLVIVFLWFGFFVWFCVTWWNGIVKNGTFP